MTATEAVGDTDHSAAEAPAPAWREAHRRANEAGKALYRDPRTGLLVFTEAGLKRRGACCGSGCRHCPYHHEGVELGDRGRRAQRPTWLAPAPSAGEAADVLFWSGGKDSLLAYRRLIGEDARPVVLLTTFSGATRRVAHQEVHIDSVTRQAEALGVPLLGVPLHAGIPYVDHIADALELVPGVARIVFGDLHLEHIRHWRATALAGLARALGAKLHFPLWGASYKELMADLEASGVPCRVSAVTGSAADSVRVGDSFGREMMARLPAGVDAFGENGEFHTLARVWEVSPDETGGVLVPRGGTRPCERPDPTR